MHFHAEKNGEWEIAIDILASSTRLVFQLKWGKRGPTAGVKRQLLAAIEANREALVREWNAKVNNA